MTGIDVTTIAVPDNGEWLTRARFFTRYPGLYQSQGAPWRCTLADLAELVLQAGVIREKTLVPGFSPTMFTGHKRCKANVEWLDALVIDYEPPKDKETKKPIGRGDSIEQITATWAPFARLVFSSYNHDPETNRRYRVVLPITRPVTREEHERLSEWVVERCATPNLDRGATTNAAAFWYLPARRPGAAPLEFYSQPEGLVIDPDRLLAALPPPPVVEVRAVVVPDVHDGKNPAYCEAALHAAVRAIAEARDGERSHTLNRQAYALGGLVGAGGLPESLVHDLLLDATRAASWPLERKTLATLERALAAGIAKPRTIPGLTKRSGADQAAYVRAHAEAGEAPEPEIVVEGEVMSAEAFEELLRQEAQDEDSPTGPLLADTYQDIHSDEGYDGDDVDSDDVDSGWDDVPGPPAPPTPPPPAAPPPPPEDPDDDDDGERPKIEIDPGGLHLNIDEGVKVLERCSDIYTRGAMLMQVLPIVDPDGKPLPTLRPLPKATLREKLCRVADWTRFIPDSTKPGGGDWSATQPTDAILHAIHERGSWPNLRPLIGVVRTPFLREDGTVCARSGYDPSSAYVLDMTEQFPAMPENPTLADAQAAIARIVDLFCDFPCTDVEKLVPVAALLSILARPGMRGANVPAFLFDANTRGVGKSLMMDTVCILANGAISPKSPWQQNEEMEKVLAGVALGGEQLACFDNISQKLPFGGAGIDVVLTCAGRYQPRILGGNERPVLPWQAVLMASGNNVSVVGDTRRRVLICRQVSEEENPEERTGFKYDLETDPFRLRTSLVIDALTVLRAHRLAGMPLAGIRPLGSFARWSQTIAAAIAWATGHDILTTLPKDDTADDPELSHLAELLDGWHRLDSAGYGLRLGTVAEKLYPPRERGEPLPDDDFTGMRESLEFLAPSKKASEPFDAKRLGYKMRAILQRPMRGLVLREAGKARGSVMWKVERLARTPGGGSGENQKASPEGSAPPFPPTSLTLSDGVFGSREGSEGSEGSFELHAHASAPAYRRDPAHAHVARDRAGTRTHASAQASRPDKVPSLPSLPSRQGKNAGGEVREVGGKPLALPSAASDQGEDDLTDRLAVYDAQAQGWRESLGKSGWDDDAIEDFILGELGHRPRV